MKARPVLILLSVFLVSGCVSNAPANSSNQEMPEGEVTTYTIDTGNSSLQEVKSVLDTRLSKADVPHRISRIVENSTEKKDLVLNVEKGENITELLRPGVFEVLISFDVSEREEISYDTGSRNRTFRIARSEGKYIFGGKSYSQGENFSIGGRRAFFDDGKLYTVVYSGEDIVSAGSERFIPARSTVQASVRMTLSKDAARHMHSLLQNYQNPETGSYLKKSNGENARIKMKFNGETLHSLVISESFQRRPQRRVSISVTSDTREKAREKIRKMRASIISGKLPEGVEIVRKTP